jgi:uncharacterized membrane protein
MNEPLPPPPPSAPPPPPAGPPAGGASDNRNLMLVLAYLWIFALIPLLIEKNDREVQWHAKHGLVLLGAEIIAYIVLAILAMIPVLGCVIALLPLFLGLGVLILRIMLIMKAINGERMNLPGLTPLVEKF